MKFGGGAKVARAQAEGHQAYELVREATRTRAALPLLFSSPPSSSLLLDGAAWLDSRSLLHAVCVQDPVQAAALLGQVMALRSRTRMMWVRLAPAPLCGLSVAVRSCGFSRSDPFSTVFCAPHVPPGTLSLARLAPSGGTHCGRGLPRPIVTDREILTSKKTAPFRLRLLEKFATTSVGASHSLSPSLRQQASTARA